jgi:hypothetical protein
MPLRQLADEIIRLSERYRSTPVLVTPSYLSLRKRFFLELVGTLAEITDRPIRIDWYRGMPSLFSLVGDRIASAHAASMNRALASLTSGRGATADLQITGLIARPSEVERELVIGLCDQRLALPTWTTPIRLGTSPSELAVS